LRKVCGCALRRTRDAVLLQASIPTARPSVAPSDVIVGGVTTDALSLRAEDLAVALSQVMGGLIK
jgi:hypothetical protein